MAVIIEQAPRTSAINRARLGESTDWDLVAQLLSVVANKLSVLVWLNTEDGAKGRNFPEPILWPAARDEVEEQGGWAAKMRGKAEPITDIAAWLAKRNPAQHSGA